MKDITTTEIEQALLLLRGHLFALVEEYTPGEDDPINAKHLVMALAATDKAIANLAAIRVRVESLKKE